MYPIYFYHDIFNVYKDYCKCIEVCNTTAMFRPRRKKLKGWQKNKK
jgi:hypothetical protein